MKNRILNGILRRLWFMFDDKTYLKLRYRLEMGKSLDFKKCRTMNEKLQWLKLYNRKPEMTDIIDKVKVKDIIKKRLGEKYVIPTLKVWNHPDDITPADIDMLPDSFVIKTNHSGGNTGVYICKDKSKINLNEIKGKMLMSWNTNIYNTYREWPYKNVDKKVFAEQYMGTDLVDYKFFCFNGEADSVMMCLDRNSEEDTKFYFFDKEWKLRRYNKRGKEARADFTLPKPEGMDKMFEIASMLSKGIPFVRVDLYNVGGNIYFGELTYYPASGFDPNILPESDIYFGDKIDLSIV